MKSLSEALCRRIVPGLVSCEAKDRGVRDWLVSGTHGLMAGQASTEIVFDNILLEEFVEYLLFDFQRFSLSSWESFSTKSAEVDVYGSVGWPFLKLYYSAFFACHAIMRSNGIGVVRIDDGNVLRDLNDLSSMFSVGYKFNSGNYVFRVFQKEDYSWSVSLEYLPNKGGGAHDAFWKQFCFFLDKLAEDISSKNEVDSLSSISDIGIIKGIITNNGRNDGGWLSVVRNKLNYSHEYGVWFPVVRRRDYIRMLRRVKKMPIDGIRFDVDDGNKDLNSFLAASHCLATLNFEVSEEMSSRPNNSRMFGAKWSRLRKDMRDGAQ